VAFCDFGAVYDLLTYLQIGLNDNTGIRGVDLILQT